MAKPYWKYPGVLNGRIQPPQASANDGSWVFCLGEDSDTLPDYVLDIGDEISVEQDFDFTGVSLIRIAMRLRTRTMPAFRQVLSAQSAEMLVAGLFAAGDGCVGIDAKVTAFQASDCEQWANISGFANPANNGVFRISGIGANLAGDPLAAAIVENAAAVAELGGAVSLDVNGARWVARAYVDASLRIELVEPAGAGWHRSNLVVHASQLAGVHTLKYVLTLEAVTS